MCFPPYLGIEYRDGGLLGVPNLLMQFFTPGGSKIEVSESYFFDTMATQNDHPTYVKDGLGCMYVFSTLFGHWVLGGRRSPKGLVPNLLMQFFTPGSSIIEVSEAYFFDTRTTQMTI